jgi:membrane protein YdbS with pleckstrin-like domain
VLPAETEPPIADAVEHPLDPAWIELQRIVGWIVFAVLAPLTLIGVLVTLFVGSLSMPLKALLIIAWLAMVVLLAWLAQQWPPIEYRYFRYRIDAQGIDIRLGVVWRRLISVPRSRVQHIDVAQGPLERRYGLASLSIYTAGTEFAKVDLPGLPYPRAVRIRDHLLPGREHGADDGT